MDAKATHSSRFLGALLLQALIDFLRNATAVVEGLHNAFSLASVAHATASLPDGCLRHICPSISKTGRQTAAGRHLLIPKEAPAV